MNDNKFKNNNTSRNENSSEFRVICEYCGSYVDVQENMICPNCGAPLEEAIVKLQTKIKLENIEKHEEAAKREKQLQDMKDRDEVFDFIKALAGSAAGAGVARSLTGILGDFIKDDIKKSFRRK